MESDLDSDEDENKVNGVLQNWNGMLEHPL